MKENFFCPQIFQDPGARRGFGVGDGGVPLGHMVRRGVGDVLGVLSFSGCIILMGQIGPQQLIIPSN